MSIAVAFTHSGGKWKCATTASKFSITMTILGFKRKLTGRISYNYNTIRIRSLAKFVFVGISRIRVDSGNSVAVVIDRGLTLQKKFRTGRISLSKLFLTYVPVILQSTRVDIGFKVVAIFALPARSSKLLDDYTAK